MQKNTLRARGVACHEAETRPDSVALCRVLVLFEYDAVLFEYDAVLFEYDAVLFEYDAVLFEYDAVLFEYDAVLFEYDAVLFEYDAVLFEYNTVLDNALHGTRRTGATRKATPEYARAHFRVTTDGNERSHCPGTLRPFIFPTTLPSHFPSCFIACCLPPLPPAASHLFLPRLYIAAIMDLFLLNGEPDDLSLQDMIEKDMKCELALSTFDQESDNFSVEFSLSSLESDVCMRAFEPLFDGLPSMEVDSPCAPTPPASSAHSSCSSSSSSLDDDQTSVFMEPTLGDLAWYGSSHKDILFDLDNAIMVNPSIVLPSSLATRVSQPLNIDSITSLCPSNCSTVTCNTSISPLLTSPSPLLSSSSVMLSGSCADQTSQGDSLLSLNGNLTTRVSLPSIHSPTVYIKTETLQSNVSSSSTVQCTGASSNSTQVAVLRPTVTVSSGGVINSSCASAVTPTVITSPKQLTQQQIAKSLITHHSQSVGSHRVQLTTNSSAYNSNNRTSTHSVIHSSDVTTAASIASVHTTINNGPMFRGKPASSRSSAGRRGDERVLPKPAYSYSCLIALALKNSTTGSLPVSEIYSFMCEYFPYFRTAPNGWKNSVRHNLSLNKCFEKIEKPAVSGNNQRKGCLWALNPDKVHKMDEEIQKWSKKDLQGIRDAMSAPDVLGALERGEMKFEAANSASSCSEDDDEDDEVDTLMLTEPPTSLTVLTRPSNPAVVSRCAATVVHQPRTTLQVHTTTSKPQQPAILRHNSQPPILATAKVRTSINNGGSNNCSATPIFAATVSTTTPGSPEYILPDSTMTEISFQANGALLDDLGNELNIEDEVSSSSNIGVCVSSADVSSITSLGSIVASNSIAHIATGVTSNTRNGGVNISSGVANVNAMSSPRSLVLRKLPLTPVRSSALRANYVYSPALGSAHGLNRLVLTNAKIA
ncbi:Fork head domain [Trinorchestia longiramus]|nr:Fork head domain [Trinorchestia longiramus]